MVPPNCGGGGGSSAPAIVVGALGEPGVPVFCWADAGTQNMREQLSAVRSKALRFVADSIRVLARASAPSGDAARRCRRAGQGGDDRAGVRLMVMAAGPMSPRTPCN